MTMTLDDLAADAQNRKTQLTQLIAAPNPPSWNSFTANGTGFAVSLSPPLTNSGAAYLGQGTGLNFPTTNATSTSYAPVFYYQVQTAADAAFTTNVQTFDMGTSTTYQITQVSGAAYAQARARFVNSAFSQWQPFGSQASGTVFRPFQFTSVSGAAATNPYRAMDGDLTTFAIINGNGAGANTVFQYGPFNNFTLTSGLTLSIISQVFNVDNGTVKLDYSVDAGNSFTNIYSVITNRAKTTDTVTLGNNLNLALVRVQFTLIATNNTIDCWETYIQ